MTSAAQTTGLEVPAAASAPEAPGRLGEALELAAAQAYLDALGRWRDARRAELDVLDQAALQVPGPGSLTADVTLSMALWQSVADRYELLLATWGSGRVGVTERTRLASLVWGRLDPPVAAAAGSTQPPSALAVSLPEACRLSDALVAQLRTRIGLDPSGTVIATRVRTLRAQLERLRDQAGLEPADGARQRANDHVDVLARRLGSAVTKAERGGDVGGLLGPLEIESATLERDLIVGAAQRREHAALASTVRALREQLEARELALQDLAQRCVVTVRPAPRYAVPDVDALGPVPDTAPALTAYESRLGQVARALTLAEQAYAGALRAHDDHEIRLGALRVKAEALGLADRPNLVRAETMAREALAARPSHAVLCEQLVTLYATYLESEAG